MSIPQEASSLEHTKETVHPYTVKIPGHCYGVKTKHNEEFEISFYLDGEINKCSTEDGILCQDVLRVLIDRVLFLNSQAPCEENILILKNLRESLIVFETRALRRKLIKHPSVETIGKSEDGHVFKVNEEDDYPEIAEVLGG